jgi:ATP-binding cassette, subfamily B, bacterial
MCARRRPERSTGAVVRLAWSAHRGRLVEVAVLAILASLGAPLTLVLVTEFIDDLLQAGGRGLGWLLAAVAAVAVLQNLADALLTMREQELAHRVNIHAESRLLQVVARAPLARFHDAVWHDQVARAVEGVRWRPANAVRSLSQLVAILAGLAGLGAVLGHLDPWFVLLALAGAVPPLVARRRAARLIYGVHRSNTERDRRRDHFFDMLVRPDLAKDIRGYELGLHFVEQHRRLAHTTLEAVLGAHRRTLRWTGAAGVLGALPLVGAYALVGGQALAGQLSAGELFLVLTAFTMLTTRMVDLFGVAADMEEHSDYLSDYLALVLARPSDVTDPEEHQVEAGNGPDPGRPRASGPTVPTTTTSPPGLFLDRVSFRYGDGPVVIDDVTLRIHPGQLVVLMGENAAGKSTLVKLLTGLVTPVCGRAWIGGRVADRVSREDHMAVLFQEYGRYELSVSEGVGLGRVSRPLDHDRVRRALEIVGMLDQVERLPRGIDHPVGRLFGSSVDLSGGQWQRLALARMLYREAAVWVLDEPTAALDASSETDVLRLLHSERGRRTILVVTHRPEVARSADRILYMDSGRVVEQGTHDDLMRACGSYAALHDRTVLASEL